MADKLLKYYKYIYDLRSFTGRIELAKRTNIPTPRASEEPDSTENINKFRNALKEITGEEAPYY